MVTTMSNSEIPSFPYGFVPIVNTVCSKLQGPTALVAFGEVKEVIGFMPPWEAFCNQRCGLYQAPQKPSEWSQVFNGYYG